MRAAGKSVEVTHLSVEKLKAMAALPPGPENMMKVFLAEVCSLHGPETASRRTSRAYTRGSDVACVPQASYLGHLHAVRGEHS